MRVLLSLFRPLLRQRGIAMVAMLTIAIGIAATTSVFSLVSAVLLAPSPYASPEKLVAAAGMMLPKGAFVELRNSSRTLDVAAVSTEYQANLAIAGETSRVRAGALSPGIFPLLGATVLQGRPFREGEDMPGSDGSAIISAAMYRDRFSSDPRVLGSSIVLDGVARQIVGVMPETFALPSPLTDFWIPARLDSRNPGDYWGAFNLRVIGRLRPPATGEAAAAEWKQLAPRIVKLFPWRMPDEWGLGMTFQPLPESLVAGVRQRLLLLQAVAAVVLIIAGVNVGTMLMSSTARRTRELAIRSALGATRATLLRQLVAEATALTGMGGLLGVALGAAVSPAVKSLFPPETPGVAGAHTDWRTLALTVLIVMTVGVAAGALPAWRIRVDHYKSRRPAQAAAGALIAVQIALALVLIVGAGLLGKSLWHLSRVNYGFSSAGLMAARVTPNQSLCDPEQRCTAFYDDLLGRLRARADVIAASAVSTPPVAAPVYPIALAVEDRPLPDGAPAWSAWNFSVTADYPSTMKIPLLAGRVLDERDSARSPAAVMVSAGFAAAMWPGQSAIGKRVKPVWLPEWRSVVGVVADSETYQPLDAPAWSKGIPGAIYFPYAQPVVAVDAAMSVLVRMQPGRSLTFEDMREVVRGVRAGIPVAEVRSMDALIAQATRTPRMTTWLVAALAVVAVMLGGVGIAGVVSQGISTHLHEIAIRLALGARRRHVLSSVLGRTAGWLAAGLLVGAAVANFALRPLAAFLFGVSPSDTLVYASAIAGCALAVALAAAIPALRALRLDPLTVLKR